jgi:hypothetical protein
MCGCDTCWGARHLRGVPGVCVGVTLFGAPDTLAIVRRDYYGRCWCNGVSHTVWDLVGARPVGVHDPLV